MADELADALGMHALFASPSYPPAPEDPDQPDHRAGDPPRGPGDRPAARRCVSRAADGRPERGGRRAGPATHPSAPLEAGPQLVDQRIDHVFFRAGREDQQVLVEGVQLAGEPVDGLHPSDHRAVVADLRWRG